MVSADYSQAVTVLREMKRQGLIKPVVGSTQLISSAILKAAPEIPIVAPATFYATMKGDKPGEVRRRAAAAAAQDQPACRRKSSPACMTPTSTRSSACISTRSRRAGVTGKPEDLEADRTKIRDYLAKLDGFQGLGGPIGFNDDGDAIKAFYVLQGENGAWAIQGARLQLGARPPGC